jgi:hypothetical protein
MDIRQALIAEHSKRQTGDGFESKLRLARGLK